MTYADPARHADAEPNARPLTERATRDWGWLVALGILSIVVGTLAVLMPLLSSIAVNAWIGAAFLVAGVAALVHAWQDEGWRGRLSHLGIGVVHLIGGVLVVLEPFAALFAFSVLVAAMMLVSGAWRLREGLRMRPERGWGWLTFAGALSLLLGVAIVLAFPGAAFWLLGTLAGAAFIVEGWALLFLGLDARRADRDAAGAA